jgi:hypothetical protein
MKSSTATLSYLTFCKKSKINEETGRRASKICQSKNRVFRSATTLNVESFLFGLFYKVKADYRFL